MNTKREAGHCDTSSGYRVFACEQCEQRDNRMDAGFACSHPVLTRACNENKSQKNQQKLHINGSATRSAGRGGLRMREWERRPLLHILVNVTAVIFGRENNPSPTPHRAHRQATAKPCIRVHVPGLAGATCPAQTVRGRCGSSWPGHGLAGAGGSRRLGQPQAQGRHAPARRGTRLGSQSLGRLRSGTPRAR